MKAWKGTHAGRVLRAAFLFSLLFSAAAALASMCMCKKRKKRNSLSLCHTALLYYTLWCARQISLSLALSDGCLPYTQNREPQ